MVELKNRTIEKKSITIFIFKKEDKKSLENFKGITLLSQSWSSSQRL